jgi:type I restriction enzyme S subunit
MENTKKVPVLRFPEFSEELLKVKFEKVVHSNKYGRRFDASDYDINGNVKTIRGTDIFLNGEIKYSQAPLAKLDNNFIKDHILQDGDLVIITTADCGLTGVFEKQDIDYIPSAYAVRVVLNENGYSYYFKYFFQTRLAKKEVNGFIRKATVANLPCSDILKIRLFLPEFTEQQKIADFLSQIDNRIEKLTKKKQLLESYKKGVMKKIFNQELRFKDDNGNDYPDWEVKKLADISIKKSSNISANKIEENEGDYKIYGASGILKKVDFFTQKLAYISIVKDGAGVGRIFLCEPETSVLGTMDIIQPKENINISFLYAVLEKIYFVMYVTGSTIPHIYFKDYSKEKIMLPVFSEQTKIANFLTKIDHKINLVSKQLEGTKQYKKGLLQKMFV